MGADKKSFFRRQFNCAHELGHIILHERYSDLNEIDREEFRERENEANAFAAALLLPATAFGADAAIYPNRLSHYVASVLPNPSSYWSTMLENMYYQ